MASTRFDKGVTNVASSTTMGNALGLDPTKTFRVFDDFYEEIDTTDNTRWTTTIATGGTISVIDADTGTLSIASDATDDDYNGIQTTNECIALTSGKGTWFKTEIQLTEATQQDVIAGLVVRDTSPIASEPSDGIYFRKDDGDANIDFVIRASSADVVDVDTGSDLADATSVSLGFYFHVDTSGVNVVDVYVDDVKVTTQTATGFPTTELCVTLGHQNGAASAETMAVDYVLAEKER